jgi:hypothetical protein
MQFFCYAHFPPDWMKVSSLIFLSGSLPERNSKNNSVAGSAGMYGPAVCTGNRSRRGKADPVAAFFTASV